MVALGASAGGLAVFERFLHLMPPGGDLAFLLVSHLDPTQESLLTELLGPHTRLSVHKAEDGVAIQAGHVYIIPPNRYMTVVGGELRLTPIPEARGARFPIDVLLRSLAVDQKENAVAIIFTGTGADGTDGLRAIKDEGGIILVQDPKTVEYAGMPDSAIATGIVDFVLPVEQMPNVLLGYARHFYTRGGYGDSEPPTDLESAELKSVYTILKARGDPVDYRAYKNGTMARRIHRRMGLAQLDTMNDYVAFLRQDPDEIDRLRKDLFIAVTSFFRDPEAWTILEEEVIPTLFKDRDADAPARVWVAGCSTGEEAYTVAMLLLEQRRMTDSAIPIQVFATDLRPDLLEFARLALYDKSVVSHIPPRLLKKYFVEETPSAYRATKELRECVAFAAHNLLSDPPFSRMDLVTCRNVLIYFQPEAQKKVIGLFHFALKQGGTLFLGGSESVAPLEKEFEPITKKWRIYRRKGKPRPSNVDFPAAATPFPRPSERRRPEITIPQDARPARPLGLATQAERWLVDNYAPAAVVINQRYDIQYIHGDLGAYLELPRGEPVLNLLTMLAPGFRGRIRVALHKARGSSKTESIIVTHLTKDGATRAARVTVRTLGDSPSGESLIIVTFEDVAAPTEGVTSQKSTDERAEDESVVRQLEAELTATKSDLQGTIETVETTNEELRASNEEIMSMNEEFRSTNEELETSKEELQSLNEELSTVNSELREKVQALERVTNDLTNLLASTDIPTLFLDGSLRIRRYTATSKPLLNLIPSDVGRPLSDISAKFDDGPLVDDIQEVMRTLAPSEKEITSHAARRYLRRIRPYRTEDNRIDGVVVTFIDIEQMKSAEDRVLAASKFAEAIVETIREPLLVIDPRFVVQSANRAYYKKFGDDASATLGRSVFALGRGQWDQPALQAVLEQALIKDVRDHPVEVEFSTTGKLSLLINSRRLRPIGTEGQDLIVVAFEDITATKRDLEELEGRVRSRTADIEKTTLDLRHINESLDAFSHVVGHDIKEPVRAVESLLHVLQEDHSGELSEDGRKLVSDTRAANARLARLISGLLALSRASRIDYPNIRGISVTEALEAEVCKTRYEALLIERQAQIAEPSEDVRVQATPESLCQVLGNLVLNALKHNPRPKPRVRVHAFPAAEKDMVEVVVEDDGPGFTSDVLAGFETMSSTTRGFGLIIARRTVENLGGRMWLEKSPSGGGAVHFTLRAASPP